MNLILVCQKFIIGLYFVERLVKIAQFYKVMNVSIVETMIHLHCCVFDLIFFSVI